MLDLSSKDGVTFEAYEIAFESLQEDSIMKLAVRIFALSIVFAGAAAASVSSTPKFVPSHQSATAQMPVPICGPGMPGCPLSR